MLKLYRKLNAVEKVARDNQLSADSRFQLRQEKSVPILAAFKKWLDYHLLKN